MAEVSREQILSWVAELHTKKQSTSRRKVEMIAKELQSSFNYEISKALVTNGVRPTQDAIRLLSVLLLDDLQLDGQGIQEMKHPMEQCLFEVNNVDAAFDRAMQVV